MESYAFHTVSRDQALAASQQLLHSPIPNAVIAIDRTEAGAIQQLARVDHIFTDADGTLVREGAEMIDQQVAALVAELAKEGIGTTVVTGKPLAEVEPILKAAPTLEFICEKGAYTVRRGQSGTQKDYLLGSAALEQEVQQFKAKFQSFLLALAKKYNVGFAWAGSRAHTCMVSFDIFAATPPENYLQLRGPDRDALKLNDPHRVQQIEAEIAEWVHTQKPAWKLTHLANGNTEITPGTIEKSTAIKESPALQRAQVVLLLGDSKNDEPMFALKAAHPKKVLGGLVLHRQAGLELLPYADFVTVGMANCTPLLAATLQALGI